MNGLRAFVTDAQGPDPANPVVGSGAISVAVALLTADDPTTIGVRELAPTPLVIATAADGYVHPVIAGLDLSTTSRGREILTAWTSPSTGKPVWL